MNANNVECLFYSQAEVAHMLGIEQRTLSRWEKDGDFPKGLRMTPTTIKYRKQVVHDWIQKLESNAA